MTHKLQRLVNVPVRLLAKDGHTSQGALGQIPESVEAGTAAVLSVGGNDALHSSFVLAEDSEKVCHALRKRSLCPGISKISSGSRQIDGSLRSS